MRFVDVNKVGCEWLGLTREELLSLGPHDVLNTPREQLEREYDAVIAEGATGMRSESTYTSKDGRMGWAETHRRALRSEDGWIVVTISRDITERKRAEQRQAAHLRYQERVARFGQAALVKSDAAELVEKAVQAALEALGAEGRASARAVGARHGQRGARARAKRRKSARRPVRLLQDSRRVRRGGTELHRSHGERARHRVAAH
jgi:PAS domain S-box-containing protein